MANFKERATQHLKDFVKERDITFENYCILHDKDAIKHQFIEWPTLETEIEKRRKIKDKNGIVKAPFKNMLRSEHIPYNLFVPLKCNENKKAVIGFFKKLLNRNDLIRISQFEIEWAPQSKPLYDKTSFDTYLEFELTNSKKLGVGIEVKYTEKSYPFTQTEKSRLEIKNQSSPYYKVWSDPTVSIYEDGTFEDLGLKKHKQLFRNHLLGLSMIKSNIKEERVDEFISLLLYPSANEYQRDVAESYKRNILPAWQKDFMAITYKQFIIEAKMVFRTEKEIAWTKYLEERYEVK